MPRFASQLNKDIYNNPFKINTEDFESINLETLYRENGKDRVYQLLGVYILKNARFGGKPIAIIDGYKVYLPKHLLNNIQTILDNEELTQSVIKGKLGFKIEPYETLRGQFYSVKWLDL